MTLMRRIKEVLTGKRRKRLAEIRAEKKLWRAIKEVRKIKDEISSSENYDFNEWLWLDNLEWRLMMRL